MTVGIPILDNEIVQAKAAEINFQISVVSIFKRVRSVSKNYIFSPNAKSPASPRPGTI